jgi:hypothetical protein
VTNAAVTFVLKVDYELVSGRADEDFLVVEKRDQNDDRDRNAEKPKQNSAAQMTLLNAAFTRIVSRRSTLRRLNLFQLKTAHSTVAY